MSQHTTYTIGLPVSRLLSGRGLVPLLPSTNPGFQTLTLRRPWLLLAASEMSTVEAAAVQTACYVTAAPSSATTFRPLITKWLSMGYI